MICARMTACIVVVVEVGVEEVVVDDDEVVVDDDEVVVDEVDNC